MPGEASTADMEWDAGLPKGRPKRPGWLHFGRDIVGLSDFVLKFLLS